MPRPEIFIDDVVGAREFPHGLRPALEIGIVARFGDAAVVDADEDVRKGGGKVEEVVEERDARVDARDEVVALQELEAGAPGGIDEIAALAEIADAADILYCMCRSSTASASPSARWHSATMPCG